MPFNYLLDERVLASTELKLENAVLMFDEAHNIDRISEEGYSLELSQEQFNQAEREIRVLMDAYDKAVLRKTATVAK